MENSQVREEEFTEGSISFRDILRILRKHLIPILLFILLGGAAGVGYTIVEAPEYVAKGTMMASPESTTASTSKATEYSGMQMIAETFVSFVKEEVVLDKTVDYLIQLDEEKYGTVTAVEIANGLSVSNDNLIIRISYSSSDPDISVDVVNAVMRAAQDIAFEPGEKTPYTYPLLGGNLAKLSPCKEGKQKSHAVKNVAICLALGAVVAAAYVILFELFDNSFKNEKELEDALRLPILSSIPFYDLDATSTNSDKKEGK